jgi:ribonuclease P protein subunit POP4
MIAPGTLRRHELVGLDAEVVSASNPDVVGLAGRVVAETTKMLGIERDGGTSRVPKADAAFRFDLPGSKAAVRVEGERLVARPARRSERSSDSRWR